MAKTILNVKTDKDVKERAQMLAKELGLPLSTVVNAFLKQFIREKEVFFSSGYKMTPYLERVIEKAEIDRKTGENIVGPFIGKKQLQNYFDSLE